jgi:hypothetical protein
MAKMRRAIDRGATDVHRNLPRLSGFKGHDLALSGIEEVQHDRQRYLSPNPSLRVHT